jgi:hypothetical protein
VERQSIDANKIVAKRLQAGISRSLQQSTAQTKLKCHRNSQAGPHVQKLIEKQKKNISQFSEQKKKSNVPPRQEDVQTKPTNYPLTCRNSVRGSPR